MVAWSFRRWLVCVLAAYLALVIMFHLHLPMFKDDAWRSGGRALRTLQVQGNGSGAVDNKSHAVVQQHTQEMDAQRSSKCGVVSDSAEFQRIGGSHFIYSAYFDDRLPKKPVVRLIALLRHGQRPQFQCTMSANGNRTVTVQATLYEMCENHAKDFGGWIISCQATDELRPCTVNVSVAGSQEQVEVAVWPTTTDDHLPMDDFSVCVPPLFGHIPSTTLVEFIELTLLLGAAHLTFYVHEASLEMHRVLDHYKTRGDISWVQWQLPVPSRAVWYHGQLLAINDCLYRSMEAFKFVAFNDIDEFIVPQQHPTWAAMVAELAPDPNVSGFSFQSAFFDPMLHGSPGSRVLYDLESDLRTKMFSQVRRKAMVMPRRVFELGIHHISRPLHDHLRPVDVQPETAFLHHYRKCITDFDPRMNCQVYRQDRSLSRHIPSLRHNVHLALWTLKERHVREMARTL